MTTDKIGRNDLCPCGSGKKYKQCCLLKKQKEATPLGKRKFTAKVLSGGGVSHIQSPNKEEKGAVEAQAVNQKAIADYNTLMERSFGQAIHDTENAPNFSETSSDYLLDKKE